MSDRERKLLTFASIAGFIILNIVGFSFARAKRVQVDADRRVATDQLALVQNFLSKSEQVTEEMDWLTAQTFETDSAQSIQSRLLNTMVSAATNAGLTGGKQDPQPADTTGKHYHKAKVKFDVTGNEAGLYDWFEKLNDPTLFRNVTRIVLKPNSADDAKIDCTATVEQWYIPQSL